MTRPVFIAAITARTAVGLTGEAAASAVRAGVSRVMAHPFFIDDAGDPLYCACDPQLDPELLGVERLQTIAARALVSLGTRFPGQPDITAHIAIPEPRPGFMEQDVTNLARTLSAAHEWRVRCASDGHAGALRPRRASLIHAFTSGRSRIPAERLLRVRPRTVLR